MDISGFPGYNVSKQGYALISGMKRCGQEEYLRPTGAERQEPIKQVNPAYLFAIESREYMRLENAAFFITHTFVTLN